MSVRHDEKDLIDRARGGDRAALETLLTLHLDQLSAHVAGRMPARVKSSFDVEDVTQHALLEAFVKINRLRETSRPAFVAWLKAIGEIALLRFLRDQGRMKRGGQHRQLQPPDSVAESVANLLDQLPDSVKTASSVVARRQAVSALRVGLAGLPADQRQAIHFHLLSGMSVIDAAKEMDRTPAAIRGLIHRGKQNLVASMGRASDWLG